jgi:transcriptional regulator with XRE-family HTH domain
MRADDLGRQRGRPASPPGNSLGKYLRDLRLARGWTIRELARAVDLSDSSAAYISQIEAGLKVPNHTLAQLLADRLGDPKGVFPLWAEIGGRKDPHRAAAARRELARILEDPSLMHDARFARPGTTRFERLQEMMRDELAIEAEELADGDAPRWIPEAPDIGRLPEKHVQIELRRSTALRPFGSAGATQGGYRVPILDEGQDPRFLDMHLFAEREPIPEYVRIGAEALGEKKLERPFAYRMTESSILRVATVLKPGDVVVFSQDPVRIVEHEIYAIRFEGGIELAHAMWNGHLLLVMPNPGNSDFELLKLGSEEELAKTIAGHMVTVIRAGSAT